MYARVTTGEMSPDDIEKFVKTIEGNVIPRATELQGFQGGYWLADRESGRVLGITLFDSEETLLATQGQAESIRDTASSKAGLPAPRFSTYEVVASVAVGEISKAA